MIDNADGLRILNHGDSYNAAKSSLSGWYEASNDVKDPVEWFNTLHAQEDSEDDVDVKGKGKEVMEDDDLNLREDLMHGGERLVI